MITTFRPKTQRTQAIDVTNPSAQAPDIAVLVKATFFNCDLLEGTASFNVDPVPGIPGVLLTVRAGQVISVTDGVTTIEPRDDFYAKFEEDNSV